MPRSRASPIKVGKVPFQAIAKAIIGGEYEGFAKVIGNKETDDTLGIHIIGPHATDLIAEASVAFELEATPWEIGGVDPRPPDAVARSSARRRWPSTAGRSTSDGGVVEAPRRAGKPASHLGDAVGLSDDDLLEMYRLVALARAVDERMWILNRAGRIPFVISGQGHEGAQVGIAWALEKGKDWIAPFYRSIATCLTFGMSAARHPDRAVRDGDRPVVRRPPDARPLRLARAQPRVGVVAGRDPAAPRGRDRARGEDPQDRPGRDDDRWARARSNQGDVHEGLNFAAIHKLPFIFVVENNGYAISVPLARQVAGSSVAERAAGYGIPGVIVDGADVLACYAAATRGGRRGPARATARR